MSNYLAIATVTATLQRILQNSLQIEMDGARVTTVKPDSAGTGIPETGVNLFLYQVTINRNCTGTYGNVPRETAGQSAKRRHMGLDLYYLLSFYGNEVELEPQRLLGCVVRKLQDHIVLKPPMIRDTLADSSFSFLADSDLADQVEMLNFKALDLSLEELTKIWSVFFQTPYALSIAYQATVVVIEGEDPAQQALPVRQRMRSLEPFFAQPFVERVVSLGGVYQPILADSTLLIRGQRLKNDITQVRIGGVEVTPVQVSPTQIILPLSSVPNEALRAGVQSLQVVNQVPTSRSPQMHVGVESNAAPFVLRPTVTQVRVSHVQVTGEEQRSADVTCRLNLAIAKTQRVVLLLNEISTNNPAAYIFEGPKRRQDNTNSITFAIAGVKPGQYLVRVQVDGAESMLKVDTNPQSPTFEQYIEPKIVLSNKRTRTKRSAIDGLNE